MTVHPVGVPLIDLIPVLLVNRYRIVAVTDQRILVLDTGRWSVKTARAVLTELPRSTRLGPARGPLAQDRDWLGEHPRLPFLPQGHRRRRRPDNATSGLADLRPSM